MKALILVATNLTVLSSGYAGVDDSFSLAVGETASVEGTDLSLTFDAVTRDSRCPKDVSCIVAGEAVVVFVARLGGEHSELTFKVPPGGPGRKDEQALDRFTITIVELEPETDSTTKIDASDYVATVVVTTR